MGINRHNGPMRMIAAATPNFDLSKQP